MSCPLFPRVGAGNSSIVRMELNGTAVTPIATFAGGDCRYATFSRPNWLFWTTADGRLYKFDTSRDTVTGKSSAFRFLCCVASRLCVCVSLLMAMIRHESNRARGIDCVLTHARHGRGRFGAAIRCCRRCRHCVDRRVAFVHRQRHHCALHKSQVRRHAFRSRVVSLSFLLFLTITIICSTHSVAQGSAGVTGDAQWAAPSGFNDTRAIITLNGAVVMSTSSGISFVFS